MRFCAVAVGVCAVACAASASARPQRAAAELRWAADPQGGAPYVQAKPSDPSQVEGFEVDLAGVLARAVARTPTFVLVAFESIDQSVARGDADLGLNGLEDTPARRAAMATTIPYYEFREVLTVRSVDADRFRTLADLAGRRVGTLGGALAYDMLLRAGARYGFTPVSYDDDVHPYDDLELRRVDAVLLDNVIANRRVKTRPGLTIQPQSVAIGHYVGVLAPRNAPLRDALNEALRTSMRDGTLEAILRRWGVWNDDQPPLYAKLLAGVPIPPVIGMDDAIAAGRVNVWDATRKYLPTLLEAAGVTIVLSCLSMAAAIAIGIMIASGRVYGNRVVRLALGGYVELMRGTPILLQLFVIYYGMAAAIRLPAFVAALAGLALNYAAYESEIYRSALEAVSVGQIEAARTLGFSERQILTLVRGPQAFRLALAPMTNDFVALLKDSSLVSVITVVELTKQTAIYATNVGSWVIPGILCSAVYLVMSLPLARLARRLERRWSTG
ncbi:MAG: ABC transporter substrate-binding protein/permease [Vicinamibacterales bacterium]